MLEDVVVVGGSAALEGLGDRLEEELKGVLPEGMGERVDVRVPGADELRHRCVLCVVYAVGGGCVDAIAVVCCCCCRCFLLVWLLFLFVCVVVAIDAV